MSEGKSPVKYLKQAQSGLISLTIAGVCIRVLWWAVEPFLPTAILLIVIITVVGWIINIALNRTHRL